MTNLYDVFTGSSEKSSSKSSSSVPSQSPRQTATIHTTPPPKRGKGTLDGEDFQGMPGIVDSDDDEDADDSDEGNKKKRAKYNRGSVLDSRKNNKKANKHADKESPGGTHTN